MATYTNKNGTNDADTLTYDKSGTYYAYNGKDTIKVTGGSVVVYTGSGNNLITVTGGSNHTINTAATVAESDSIISADTLTISNADVVDAILGSGKDVINISNSNGKKSNGALAQLRAGVWGDTFNINAGTENYQLYGEAGDDIFNVYGGNNLLLWGGAAKDTFNIYGGYNNKIYGGDSEDTITVGDGTSSSIGKQTIYLGYGGSEAKEEYDTVTVNAGNAHTIYANLGINEIYLKGGNNHIIKADIDRTLSKKKGYTDAQINAGMGLGYGQDKLYIDSSVTGVTANLGDGKDYVEIKGGSGHNIDTEGWNDKITIRGKTTNSRLCTGEGHDSVYIDKKLETSVVYLGAGNDYLSAQVAPTYCIVDAGAGDDSLSFYNFDDNYLEQNLFVKAGAGNDTITLKGNSGMLIKGGQGNDEITLQRYSNGSAVFDCSKNLIYCGEGADTIDSQASRESYLSSGEGDDYIKTNYNDNCTFNLGKGNDRIQVFGGQQNKVILGTGSDFCYNIWEVDSSISSSVLFDANLWQRNDSNFINVVSSKGAGFKITIDNCRYQYDKNHDILRMYRGTIGTVKEVYIDAFSKVSYIGFGRYLGDSEYDLSLETRSNLMGYMQSAACKDRYEEKDLSQAILNFGMTDSVDNLLQTMADTLNPVEPGIRREILAVTGTV